MKTGDDGSRRQRGNFDKAAGDVDSWLRQCHRQREKAATGGGDLGGGRGSSSSKILVWSLGICEQDLLAGGEIS